MRVKKSDLLIGGQMCPPTSGRYYPLYSPVDGTLVAEVADASRADVDRAAAAAREAFYAEWKFCGIEHKRALFAKLKEVLYAMADELAAAKVQPQGAGIPPLIERVIDYYVGKLDDGAGALIEHGDQGTNYVYREPLGVVAIFAPFNGPMLGALLAAVPALVAGNTVILKAPDQEAPQALKTMQAFHEAGFPAGVVNALSGKGPEVGQALVAHPATRLISFTGSTATGKKIMAAAAEDLKRVQLNLGSKTAQIVLPDADLEAAATATVGSAFPGQACSAISRVLLHESLRDEFIALLKEKRRRPRGPSMLIRAFPGRARARRNGQQVGFCWASNRCATLYRSTPWSIWSLPVVGSKKRPHPPGPRRMLIDKGGVEPRGRSRWQKSIRGL